MKLYWGDLHNHCNITYGFGSLENAMKLAKAQLDFVTITGHAMWPDIYEKTPDTEYLIRFHLAGFEKLRQNWYSVRDYVAQNNKDHEFVTFQGYEMHSTVYGDHHFITPSDQLELFEAENPAEWIEKSGLSEVIAIPHHIAYTPGYRGIKWDAFCEANSPVVEVVSKHGCSMSCQAPYNYYHNMGPRDGRNTVFAGLKAGHKFGFVGSTDHHAGCPGSYGDGRLAVLAEEKTREGIWDAIKHRRTYAVTGDKIEVDFRINGAPFGSEITCGGKRNIALDVTACDFIDKIVLYKNCKPIQVVNGEFITDDGSSKTYKVRVEMGWGKPVPFYHWNGNAVVEGGKLLSVEPCFRGASVLSPQKDQSVENDVNRLSDELMSVTDTEAVWQCDTFKNISPQHSETSAVILEIEGTRDTTLHIKLNEKETNLKIADLMNGSITNHMKPYHSQAFAIHQAVPQKQYRLHFEWADEQPENDCDFYHLEIRQTNGQCAWVSPIYVNQC